MAKSTQRILSLIGMVGLGLVVTTVGICFYLVMTSTPLERRMLNEGVEWEQVEGAIDQLNQPIDKPINPVPQR